MYVRVLRAELKQINRAIAALESRLPRDCGHLSDAVLQRACRGRIRKAEGTRLRRHLEGCAACAKRAQSAGILAGRRSRPVAVPISQGSLAGRCPGTSAGSGVLKFLYFLSHL